MRTRITAFTAAVWACVSLGLVTGCAAHPTSNSAFTSDFERAIAATQSDFQQEILQDHKITDAEYAAARERFSACMKAAGIPVQLQEGGGYTAREYRSDEDFRSDTKCNEESLTQVESLYLSMRANPDNRSYFARVVECLQKEGIADETLTESDVETIFNEASQLSDEERVGYSLPSGTPVDDPTVIGCFTIR